MSPIVIQVGKRSYEAWVGSGLLEKAGAMIAQRLEGRACAIISDENVARHFADTLIISLTSSGLTPLLIVVPPGEKSKTIQKAEVICQQMADAGLDRSSFLITLGGGMIGDLGGFVAAIYHRGISYVQMPTTLLAQVDSSIGGKTAVNIAGGKNLVGAWHQPALIFSDTDTLASLPARERQQGFAEIIKHSVIRDAEMFEVLHRFDQQDLAALVRRNVKLKADIVAADERELTGERALLNFGHTVGHAIERASDSFDFRHGEAVSLGMVVASEISVRNAGLPESDRDRIVNLLRTFDLPTRLPPDFPREKILERIRFDKKFRQQQIRFVVTPGIGSARLATDVTMEDIIGAVEKL